MTQLHFFVLPDDGLTPVLDALNAAKRTLDIYVFRLESDAIATALADAVGRGVAVRAILDNNAATAKAAYHQLQQAGVNVKWSPPYFVKSHAKCFVADGAVAAIFTLNFVDKWEDTRDYGIISDDRAIIAAFEASFEADWQLAAGQPSAAQVAPLIVSPVNSRAAVLDYIKQAQSNLLIEHQQFSDPQVIAAIAERANAGVNVQLAVEQSDSAGGVEQLRQLAPHIVATYPQSLHIHCKLLIRDHATMLLGSLNLTAESLDQRREISLIVDHAVAVKRAIDIFQRDMGSH